MSTRNRYESAFGVVRIEWNVGAPSPNWSQMLLVEVWRPGIRMATNAANLPAIAVHAQIEARRYEHSTKKWFRLDNYGEKELAPEHMGEVRRWANLPHRWWHGNLTIDGWTR